jgi:hypothetical protein
MWSVLKLFLSRSRFNRELAIVIFKTADENSPYWPWHIEWRVKRSLDGERTFISLVKKMTDPEASGTSYVDFDLSDAIRTRTNLDKCIAFASEIEDFTLHD